MRKKFGVLFQDGALFGSMNLYDNIAFPLREHTRKNEAEIRELVHRNAELVGLMDHLKKLPGEVSGGMKKRAGLARAMVTEPEIVLFDEPDSGLDPVRVAYLDELVVTAQKETGATFFIITHNIQSVMRTADYMGVLVPLQPGEVRQQAGHARPPTTRSSSSSWPAGPKGPSAWTRWPTATATRLPRGRHRRAGLRARWPGPASRPLMAGRQPSAQLTSPSRPSLTDATTRNAAGPGGAPRNQRRSRSGASRLSRRRRPRTRSRPSGRLTT